MTNPNLSSVLPRLLPPFIPSSVAPALSGILGFRQIEETYFALRSDGDGRPFLERLLHHLGVTYRVAERDLKAVPRTGPVVVVANHPCGILDGVLLTALLAALRPDVRLLANGILARIPEVRDVLIPVDPFGDRGSANGNQGGVRQALRHLSDGGLLVVFPAGEVSHFQLKERRITDSKWNPAVARIIELAASHGATVQVVPAFIDGVNSLLFQLAGLLHPRLRTILLARELLNKRRRDVRVRLGKPIDSGKLLSIRTREERINYLRWRTYLLESRREFKPRTARPLSAKPPKARHLDPVAAPVDSGLLASEVSMLDAGRRLAVSGDLAVYLAPAPAIPNVMKEIGRLRELTFRAAGEGTGKAADIDRFDEHYLHLFLWHSGKQEVAGAYRLAATDVVRHEKGCDGLYSATLFRYSAGFLDALGPALELGRSFIRAEYQKGFAPLLLLWKGIGQFVAANPRYKVLFGPVSISNEYQAISRELMVSFLERYANPGSWLEMVRARTPLRRKRTENLCSDVDELSEVVTDLDPEQPGVPVLLRQYLRLGGKILGFNVDPEFSDALDGLIVVDLTKTEPKLLQRYLGAAEAARFLNWQREQHGTH